jgi:transcriptional regulator with XRE-family HTH domain
MEPIFQYHYRYFDMITDNMLSNQKIIRQSIARQVRSLRLARRWTQAELSARLGLSQSRLSELERGQGSFAAEHLLLLSQIFNVPASEFGPATPVDEHAALQNALVRLGANHLREREDILPDARLDLARIVESALLTGEPRLVTALAPALVQGIRRLSLTRLHAALADKGFEFRLVWLLENTLAALHSELATVPTGRWARRYRRTVLVIETALDELISRHRRVPATDILDPHIRSAKSREQVEAGASRISHRWAIVSSLQPDDFARALEGSRVDH